MKRFLIVASVAVFAVCGLSACNDGPTEDDCYVSESMDNMSLEERAEFCQPYRDADAESTRPTPVSQLVEKESELTPQQKFARAYELERELERLSPTAGTDEQPETVNRRTQLPEEIFKFYFEALPAMPEAKEDVDRAFDRILATYQEAGMPDYYGNGGGTAHLVLLIEAWDAGTVDKAVLRPMLTKIRDKTATLSGATGFNPNIRYDALRDHKKFWCKSFGFESRVMHELYQRLAPASAAAKRWHLQYLDYEKLESCESSGTVHVKYEWWEQAYEGYRSLGYLRDAEEQALKIVRNHLSTYTSGRYSESMNDWYGMGDPEHLEEAEKWLKVLPPAKQRELLLKAAHDAERKQNFAIAASMYAKAGNTTDAARMTALVPKDAAS